MKLLIAVLFVEIALLLSAGAAPGKVEIDIEDDGDQIRLVPTPGGLIHPNCVYEVPSGSVVRKEGDKIIVKQGGSHRISIIPTCSHASNFRSKTSILKQAQQGKRDSGWIVWGEANGQGYTTFNGGWTVPATPASTDSQTVFFFTGLEDSAGDEIIQPVLQWGSSEAGGGSYWAVASWWVTSTGNALYSKLTQVNSGDYIYGTMEQTSQGSWTISTYINGANPTVLSVQNVSPQTMASVTLEAYNILSCGDYPTSGTITFNNMTIADQGQTVQANWQPVTEFTNCGESVKVQSSQEVTLTF